MNKAIAFVYGIISYAIFLVTFLYSIGFVGNVFVSKSIDSGSQGAIVTSLLINIILLSIFAIQHSIMARPAFKKWWTNLIPETIERSTYVLLSSLALILLYAFWQPMTGIVWAIENKAAVIILSGIFWFGWLTVLGSTFLINHFDLFGLQQVYFNLKEREYPRSEFTTIGLYNFTRHPIMTGFIIAFWATPVMTVGHLLFAVVTTIYILISVRYLEEKDLIDSFGEDYENYRKRVPMLIPFLIRKSGGDQT